MSERLMEEDVNNLKQLGLLIKETRMKMHIPQEKLAESVGISRRTLGRIETGTVNPKCTTILRIMEGLHIPQHDLFVTVPEEHKDALHSILIELEKYDPDSLKHLKRIIQTLQIILSYL